MPRLPVFIAALLLLLLLPGQRALAQDPAPTAGTGTVRGVVLDSIARRPLAGAEVQLVREGSAGGAGEAFSASTDAVGAFQMAGVPPGRYLAGFFHQALEDLGLGPLLVRVDVVPGQQTLNLSTPGPARVLAATCRSAARPDSTGLLVGRVVDAESDAPIAGATVQVQWFEVVIDKGLRQVRRGGSAHTDERGLYAICGIPTDGTLTVFATDSGSASGELELTAPAGGVLRQSLAVSHANVTVALPDTVLARARDDSARSRPGYPRGTARLLGQVRTVDTDGPLPGARVSVRGTGLSAVTTDNGSFALDGLPAGTQALDIRALGFAPRTLPVQLRAGEESRLDVEMDQRIPVLETVRVFGRAPNVGAFAQRKRRGAGHVYSQAEIARMRPFDLCALFRRVPGVQVMSTQTGHIIRFRGCKPAIYFNGMRIAKGGGPRHAGAMGMALVPNFLAQASEDEPEIDFLADPRSLTGVEVYDGPMAPLGFQNEGCGTVILWSGMQPQ